MQAVILAAGQGLRLRPFTEQHPKPLIPIAGKALIRYTLEALPDSITEVVIVVGYLGKQIRQALGDKWHDLPITYAEQPDLSGTGNALLMAKDLMHGKFLAINGDDLYTKQDLAHLVKTELGILAWRSNQAAEFGLSINDDMTLIGFDPNSTLINSGAYCLNESFFDEVLATVQVHGKTEYSLPHTLAAIAKKHTVKVVYATHWLPVGTPQQLSFANNYYIKKFK